MFVEMRFWMNTEDDDEPLTDEQWKKELNMIVDSVSKHINEKHSTFVKDADGEYTTEKEGQFIYEEKLRG